jgi:hypothetical protein
VGQARVDGLGLEQEELIEMWRNRPIILSVVTQSNFGKALFECEQLGGDPIVFTKIAPKLPSLILRKAGYQTTFGRAEHLRGK